MRILMVDPIGFGGGTHYTISLCRAITPLVSELTVLTTRTSTTYRDDEPFRIFRLLGGMDRAQSKISRVLDSLRNPLIFNDFVRKNPPHVIHFQHTLIPAIDTCMIILAHRLKCATVYSAHDVFPSAMYGSNWIRQSSEKIFLKQNYSSLDKLIVLSRVAAEELTQNFGVPMGKITLIPLGINDIHAQGNIPERKSAREYLDVAKDKVVALFFGVIKKSKGLETLLGAVPLIVQQVPEFLLLVAGELHSDNDADYEALVNQLNISEFVRLNLNYIPDTEVAYYFSVADFVVLPYRKIYQSAVANTAFAFGKPIVASNAGSLSDIIDHGKNGVVFGDSTDIRQLVDATVRICLDKDGRAAMEDYIRTEYVKRYSWKSLALKTVNLYKELTLSVQT